MPTVVPVKQIGPRSIELFFHSSKLLYDVGSVYTVTEEMERKSPGSFFFSFVDSMKC